MMGGLPRWRRAGRGVATVEVYLVGGAVRDELLGRPVADRDWVVVGAAPQQLLARGFRQVGRDFPCFLHPDTQEEYALARTERKAGRGHTGFICDFGPQVTLEEDLARRDLTINAIARAADGRYIDPYGGRADLQARVLRHVSEAFVEDPLRVLRVARFQARLAPLGFRVHPDTLALMRRLVESGELAELTPERVWKEIARALVEPAPSAFCRVLRDCGALRVLLPEIDVLFGVPQPAAHHPEIDTGEHVMLVLECARALSDEPAVAWAALLHDVGKGLTPPAAWPRHIGHEQAGVPLVRAVCGRLKVPRAWTELAVLACEYHLLCHRLQELRPATVMRLLERLDAQRRPQRLAQFALVCEADARGRLGLGERDYPEARLLLALADATRGVDVQPLLEQGLRGQALAAGLRRQRIAAITSRRSTWVNE